MSERLSLEAEEQALETRLAAIQDALDCLLRTHPEGLSELTLLRRLQAPPWQLLGDIDFSTPTALYPVHFLLFHALYRLRSALNEEGQTLDISPMCIHLRTMDPSKRQETGFHDPLQAFYLDINNLELPESIIDDMVNDFWRGVTRPASGQLETACQTLEVSCPPRTLASAKQQFRRLAMQRHPDRGGSTIELQQLNDAMAVVRQHFRHQHIMS